MVTVSENDLRSYLDKDASIALFNNAAVAVIEVVAVIKMCVVVNDASIALVNNTAVAVDNVAAVALIYTASG